MSQAVTECELDVPHLSPHARGILRLFGLMVSAYVVAVFAADESVDFCWGVILTSLGFFSLHVYTGRNRRYYAPLIFTMMYYLGYLLSASAMLLHKADLRRTGFAGIGDFAFTDSDFSTIVLVIAAGMAGILTATFIAETVSRHRRDFPSAKGSGLGPLPRRQLRLWIWSWFCFSVCLILAMWHMEIGRTGLDTKTYLPFRLAGFLVYVKAIFVPFCGMLLLDICLRGARRRLASLVLVLLLVVGVLGSLGGTSRGAFAFTVFPAILFLFLTSRRNSLSRKLLWRFSAIALVVGCVVMSVVGVIRGVAFTTTRWNLTDARNLLTHLDHDNFEVSKMVGGFLSLSTGRVGGMRELMAVVSSDVSGVGIPVGLLLGTVSEDTSRSLIYSVYGFVPPVGGGLAFGVGYGMWGQLFLSKSYLVIYLGTILLVGILLCVEEVFRRKGFPSIALLFSVLLGSQCWGGTSLFFLSRCAVLLFICYLFMPGTLKKMRKVLQGVVRPPWSEAIPEGNGPTCSLPERTL